MGLEDDQDLLLAIALSKSLMVEREGEDDDEAETSATSKDAALLEAAEAASLYDEPEEAHKQNLAVRKISSLRPLLRPPNFSHPPPPPPQDFLSTLVRTLHHLGEDPNTAEPTTNDASTLLPPLTALLTACAERELGEEQRGFLLRLAELAAALMLHPPHALLPPLAAHADAACRAFADVGIRALEGACANPSALLPNSDALATAERALACIGMSSVDAELDDESARDAVGALALALPDAASVRGSTTSRARPRSPPPRAVARAPRRGDRGDLVLHDGRRAAGARLGRHGRRGGGGDTARRRSPTRCGCSPRSSPPRPPPPPTGRRPPLRPPPSPPRRRRRAPLPRGCSASRRAACARASPTPSSVICAARSGWRRAAAASSRASTCATSSAPAARWSRTSPPPCRRSTSAPPRSRCFRRSPPAPAGTRRRAPSC